VMLCRFHHRLLHRDSGWLVRIRNGLPEFSPPKWIDQTQAARRRPPPPITRGQRPLSVHIDAAWPWRDQRPAVDRLHTVSQRIT
jgi:hypothetical protein